MGNCVFREMGLEDQVWSPDREKFLKKEQVKYLLHEERVLQIVEQRRVQKEKERIEELERKRILQEQREAAEQQRLLEEKMRALEKKQQEEQQQQQAEESQSISQDIEIDPNNHHAHQHHRNSRQDEKSDIDSGENDLNRFFTIKVNPLQKSKVQEAYQQFKQSQIVDMPRMFGNPVFNQVATIDSEVKQERFSNVFSDDD